jgi:predicted neutral ceramidase superfamily lipid hydrolase
MQTLRRFTLVELALWASLYPAYLAVRGATIGDGETAAANAADLVGVERTLSVFHEATLQRALSFASELFSAYYMIGFGPLIAAVLIWLGLRDRDRYRELRMLLFASLALAVLFYVAYPTAPPRLVPEFGITDTVGLSGHDTGSFAGIRFNPYAAMPSMHVGWSLLVGIVGFRATRQRTLRAFFALHPLLMAVTVTATGNHYFVDSAAGAAVALLTVWSLELARRMQPLRFRPRPA